MTDSTSDLEDQSLTLSEDGVGGIPAGSLISLKDSDQINPAINTLVMHLYHIVLPISSHY